jgi:hypothetical protein
MEVNQLQGHSLTTVVGCSKSSFSTNAGREDSSSPLSERAITCVKEAMSTGFESLQEPSQTFQDRKRLHKKYQSAIRGLRDELSDCNTHNTPLESVWLFAMYEVSELHGFPVRS